MKFRGLQENLRKILWDCVEAGELTGLKLAQQTGFKQAHISNFLNRKRGLSIEGMDKVLQVQHLSVLDLLDPAEVSKRATILPPSGDEFENILVTDAATAALPLINAQHVKEIVKFRKAFLHKLKAETEGNRSAWQRFVVIKFDTRDAHAMTPRLASGAALLVDRYYNALTPYRKGEQNMYAVLKNETCTIRYVEVAGNQIVLRPHNQAHPIEVITIEAGKRVGDYLVGRVCHIGMEV